MPESLVALALLLLALRLFGNHIKLRSIPGPWCAGLTDCWQWSAQHSSDYGRRLVGLHETYGRVVRLGPNRVSVSDRTLLLRHGGGLLSPNKNIAVLRQSFEAGDKPLNSVRSPPRPNGREYLEEAAVYEGTIDHLVANFVNTIKAHHTVDLPALLQYLGRDFVDLLTMDDNVEIQMTDRRALAEDHQRGHARTLLSQCTMQHLVTHNPKARMRRFCPLRRPKRTEYRLAGNELRIPAPHPWPQTGKVPSTPNARLHSILAAFTSTFCFLSRYPKVVSSLKSEIERASHDGLLSRSPRWGEINGLRYLEAVMKESMRCCSYTTYYHEESAPAGGMSLLGHFIPEKTTIVCHSEVVRHSHIYGNSPDMFDPERWMTADDQQLQAMQESLFPCESSLYACPKSYAAWLELKKAAVWILRDLGV